MMTNVVDRYCAESRSQDPCRSPALTYRSFQHTGGNDSVYDPKNGKGQKPV